MTAVQSSTPDRHSTAPGLSPMHCGIVAGRFFRLHLIGTIFPIGAGLLFFGWRAAMVMVILLLSTALATYIWQRIGKRGQQLQYSHTLWLALLLSLTLPPHLASLAPQGDADTILGLVLPAAAFALVIFTWLLGGVGSGRIHPVLVTHLLIVAVFAPWRANASRPPLLTPHTVLHSSHLILGDVNDAKPGELILAERQPWIIQPQPDNHDALHSPMIASEHLIAYTSRGLPERAWVSLESLLRDRLPPLEDLIFAGHPGPIGQASAIAVLIGGLFLLYRGLIDVRIPLLIVMAMFAAILVLPVPVVITDTARQWRWLAFREAGVGLPTAITFANYEIFASPLLFMAFFMATSPAIRPMSERSRVIYAILVGVGTAAMQLYFTVSAGPYVALLLISLLTPLLDRVFKPRPLL